jgi:dTMP kinase
MAATYENFIAIEGGDGSGKGTQAEILRSYISTELGKKVTKLSFPRYGEPSAYYAEQYLNGAYGGADDVHPDLGVLAFALDRFAEKPHLEELLADSERSVVSDRYMGSNLAHQGAKIDDTKKRREFYERTLHTEYELLSIPRPAKNVVLLVPSAIAQENVDKKDARGYTDLKRDIHEADINHLEKAKHNYQELCELYPEEFIPIDCMDGDRLRTIEDIQAEIRRILAV